MEGVGTMKKSASMGNLSSETAGSPCRPGYPSSDPVRDHASAASGYASDDPGHASCSSNCRNERKKGIPWTEEEHRLFFLLGLQKLGKGDWRGIARNFVVSRTPTLVASHAQKYFTRQANASKRKRRSSLFDMVPKMPMDHVPALNDHHILHSPQNEPENSNKLHPSLYLGYGQEPQLIEASLSKPVPSPESKENFPLNNVALPLVPTFYYPPLVPVPIPFWPSNLSTLVREEEMAENHEVLKPTPVLHKHLVIADELVSMSKLSIGDTVACRMEPSALSIKLLETSASRQSAFREPIDSKA